MTQAKRNRLFHRVVQFISIASICALSYEYIYNSLETMKFVTGISVMTVLGLAPLVFVTLFKSKTGGNDE